MQAFRRRAYRTAFRIEGQLFNLCVCKSQALSLAAPASGPCSSGRASVQLHGPASPERLTKIHDPDHIPAPPSQSEYKTRRVTHIVRPASRSSRPAPPLSGRRTHALASESHGAVLPPTPPGFPVPALARAQRRAAHRRRSAAARTNSGRGPARALRAERPPAW